MSFFIKGTDFFGLLKATYFFIPLTFRISAMRLQLNLYILDMLYIGHPFIVDTFSGNSRITVTTF